MKRTYSYEKAIALAVIIAAVGAFGLIPMAAFGQGASSMVGCGSTTSPPAQFGAAQPAAIGAGPLPQAFASNVGNQAWIYTGNPMTSAPIQTTGSEVINAIAANQTDVPNSGSRASVTANFVYPAGGSQWTVQFTCLEPTGDVFTHYGGVGINKTIFGASMNIGGLSLPQTNAQVVVFGRASIAQDGQIVASNVPAVAFESQALHDVNGAWLNASDPNRHEISLFVPGAMSASGQPVPGFSGGSFYIFWPSATYQISSTGTASGAATGTGPGTTTSSITQSGTTVTGAGPSTTVTGTPTIGNALFGSGPALPVAGANAPVGSLTINITDQGVETNSSSTIPGLYDVTVNNSSARNGGVELTGIDLCCSIYKRFSSILRPGQSQTFKWFFAPGRVTFRTFADGVRTGRAFSNVRYIGGSTSLTFQP